MKKLQLLFIVIVFSAFSTGVSAKTLGNYKSYHQITDKEVLIESTNGSQILISAYNDYALGIQIVNKADQFDLTTPINIQNRHDLNGSIYVEELDELVQITTTIIKGVLLKIEKNPLCFTVIDKTNSEVLLDNFSNVKYGKNSAVFGFSLSKDETINLISSTNLNLQLNELMKGDTYSNSDLNNMSFPNNEICLISSKGYSILFKEDSAKEINLSKSEKVNILSPIEKDIFNCILLYGKDQLDLIDKYAFHMTSEEKQVSLLN